MVRSFIFKRLENGAKEKQIELLRIQPEKPKSNAYIEHFNCTFREDVLDAYLFDDLDEVRQARKYMEGGRVRGKMWQIWREAKGK